MSIRINNKVYKIIEGEKMKKISIIWILPIMVVLGYSIWIMNNYINKHNYIHEESLSYVDVENTVETINMDTNEQCYQMISLIDFDILNMLSVEKTSKLTDEEKLDICINYIARNIEKFKSVIKNINKEFIFEENETEYYSIGYIDKVDLINISKQFFYISNFDFSSYKFYDKNIDLIAIVPVINQNIKYNNSKIMQMRLINENNYSLQIEYTRSIQNIDNTFVVEYFLDKIDGKYYIVGYNIIVSNVK
jgi:hypothetical protein